MPDNTKVKVAKVTEENQYRMSKVAAWHIDRLHHLRPTQHADIARSKHVLTQIESGFREL